MASVIPFSGAPEPAKPKVNVLIVVGTRPETFKPVIVTTGQHDRMVREVFKMAGVWADVTLWVGDAHAGLSERVSSVMLRFDDFCRQWFHEVMPADATADDIRAGLSPAAVLVHGDTSSALGAAMAAFHLRIPVVHVEAGLRAG